MPRPQAPDDSGPAERPSAQVPSGPQPPGPIGVPGEILGPDGTGVPWMTRYQETGGVYSAGRGTSVGGPTYGAPTFYEGDEVGWVYRMNPENLALFQQQLTAAGVLDPATYRPGAPGDSTVEAVHRMMAYANAAGYRTVSDAIRAYTQQNGGLGSEDYKANVEARNRPLPAPVSNADELRSVFRAAVIDTLGTGWSEERINAMVADYQAHERAYNAQAVSGEANPEEQMASAETFARNAAVEADPTAAQGQQFLGAANALTSMLGKWTG